ncbi:MAG: immune inhibitor A [Anaerolineae bacterium]
MPPRPFPRKTVNAEPPRRVPNAVRRFWVAEAATGERREIVARLRVQTPHIAMWVEEDVWHDVRQLLEAAELLGGHTYPRLRDAFGSEWSPGVDNDPRIHVLHATGLGKHVLGYTSAIDEYRKDVHPQSNEAEMITVNVDRVDVGSPVYRALLARQFQRLVQWNLDRNEERWVKEGLAELAAALSGFDVVQPRQAYLKQTDTSLTAWTDSESQRGAVYLFMAHFHQRFGDPGTRILTAEPADGTRGFDAALETLGTNLAFEDLLADWLAANFIDSTPGLEGPRHSYSALDMERPLVTSFQEPYPVDTLESVEQFGADYIILQGDSDLHLRFVGRTETPLFSVSPRAGQPTWWSNRADASLTTLTRGFDLTDVAAPALAYSLWYDLEAYYDYASVEVSDDQGENWHILYTPLGTGADPHGNSPGWGYTGRSGGWIREQVDLSEHAGQDVLVRFSCLTDEAITDEGLLVSGITLIGVDDRIVGGTSTDDWSPRGFVLTDGVVSQRYLVLVIGIGEETSVERLPLREDQTGEWTVPLGREGPRQAVLVISAMAPLTAQAASYQLSISR